MHPDPTSVQPEPIGNIWTSTTRCYDRSRHKLAKSAGHDVARAVA